MERYRPRADLDGSAVIGLGRRNGGPARENVAPSPVRAYGLERAGLRFFSHHSGATSGFPRVGDRSRARAGCGDQRGDGGDGDASEDSAGERLDAHEIPLRVMAPVRFNIG